MSKDQMVTALYRFVNQRSGIEWANYGGSREAFLGDYRPILKRGKQAREMLRFVELSPSIGVKELAEASRAYSGRLQFKSTKDGVRIEYTTGQYFPTEYRSAACAVLAQAIWDYFAADCNTREEIQKAARRNLGRGIAREWFN